MPDEATVSNLGQLRIDHSRITEQRALELQDIAHVLADFVTSDGIRELDVAEILSILGESLTLGELIMPDDTPAELKHTVNEEQKLASYIDRARLAELLIKELSLRGRTLHEGDFLDGGTEGERFTYVKNHLSDEAYDVFSEDFRDPRVKYSSSFKECAQALADGEVDYILLPLEERGGVRLPSVAELIYRYDFKISAVTPVFGYDAGADVKYALISKHFRLQRRHKGDDGYLELRLPMNEECRLSEILSVSAYFGMTVYRVNTMTLDTEGESTGFFSFTLKDGGKGFTELFVYALLFAPDLIPVGVYKNLE